MYGNICENLALLGTPQPSFSSNFTKKEWDSIFDGVIQNGFKQSYIYLLENMRTLTTDYKKP